MESECALVYKINKFFFANVANEYHYGIFNYEHIIIGIRSSSSAAAAIEYLFFDNMNDKNGFNRTIMD